MNETNKAARFNAPGAGGRPVPVKVMRKDRLDLKEKVGFIEVLKGLGFTFKQMLRPRVTVQFPEQAMPRYPSGKGQPVLVRNDDGSLRCVACGLCEFVCPAWAILIDPGEAEGPIQRGPERFQINMLRCIMCGMCEEACPKDAIVMEMPLEKANASRDDFMLEIPDLVRSRAEIAKRLEYIKGLYSKWNTQS